MRHWFIEIKLKNYVMYLGLIFAFLLTGKSGGLVLFWRSSFNCQIVDYSNNPITVEIDDPTLGPWKLTGYYGYPNVGRR